MSMKNKKTETMTSQLRSIIFPANHAKKSRRALRNHRWRGLDLPHDPSKKMPAMASDLLSEYLDGGFAKGRGPKAQAGDKVGVVFPLLRVRSGY